MFQSLFTELYNAMSGAVWIAVLASFVWGVLSILLSPCHLSSIPLIIGYISKQNKIDKKNSFLISTTFALGILLTIVIVGLITAAMGKIMGDIGFTGNFILAIILLLVGLYLMDIIPLPDVNIDLSKKHRSGLIGAIILGVLFGTALGPCTFAFFAPVLTIIFSTADNNLFIAILILLTFSIGHISVIITAGTFTSKLVQVFNRGQESKSLIWLKRICGLFVVFGAGYLIYKIY